MIREYPKTLRSLIERLKKIPGVGYKNAERMAFYLIYAPKDFISDLSTNLIEITTHLFHCSSCFALIEKQGECYICQDMQRDRQILCVIENFKDQFLFEDSLEYKGLYHILEGKLSPLDGITPDKLRLKELVERVKNQKITEVIIATSLDVAGDATAFYISKILKETGVTVSRLAKGLPFGIELEYADSLTLMNSLKNREVLQ